MRDVSGNVGRFLGERVPDGMGLYFVMESAHRVVK